jgi:ubiquinone biosynthesis protein
MNEQVGWRGLWQRMKQEAPRYAKLLPELPRLVHQNLERSNHDLRLEMAQLMQQQQRTHRLLSTLIWVLAGFAGGLAVAQLLLRLNLISLF